MERIQKLIAQSGLMSRRKAETLIAAGKVKVNNQTATLGTKASWKDQILVNQVPLRPKENLVYYLLNKPASTISSVKDEKQRPTVVDLIPETKRIFPVGRLDWDTTGLLILTNDGPLTNHLTHPRFQILRIYHAQTKQSLSEADLAFLNGPQVIINGKRSQQEVRLKSEKLYEVRLHVGTYHHVKKLFDLVNNQVIKLKRVQFGSLALNDLPLGTYRKLTPHEVKSLKSLSKNNA